MSNTFVWLVKIVCLAGSALSTWYFLQTVFPPSLFSIVPLGWVCFEVGVVLWPKYSFSRDPRTFGQRITGFVMTFVSYAGCAACFVGNVLILGPDHSLFLLSDSMKAMDVYIVVGDILLTILCAMLVTSVIPHMYMLTGERNQVYQVREGESREYNQNNQVSSTVLWGGNRTGAGRKPSKSSLSSELPVRRDEPESES